MAKLLSGLLFLISLFGCAAIDTRPEDFKVNISSMEILDSTLMEQRYLVKLRIMNRSKRDFVIEGLSFDIELNDKDFASGVSNQQIELERFSEAVVSVNVTSTLFGIIRQLHGMQQQQTRAFEYNLTGKIYTTQSMLGLPFRETGEIDLTPASKSQ